MCLIERKTLKLSEHQAYAACCGPNGDVEILNGYLWSTPPKVSKKKRRRVAKRKVFIHPAYHEQPLQMSGERLSLHIFANYNHRDMYNYWQSNGRRGRKPTHQKHMRISLRTLSRELQ